MIALLADVLDAHGGLDRWREVSAIDARGSIRGLLPTRFPGNKLATFRVRIQVARQHTVFTGFVEPGKRAVFEPGGVRIETLDGALVERRTHPRSAFSGMSGIRRNFSWDRLDLAYFGGYAMWNYLSTPFLLASEGVVVSEGTPLTRSGRRLRRLHATFPATFETHCRRQTFYVGEDGLVSRHDFVAEPVGPWAAAALIHDRHRRVGEFVLPFRRRVMPRGPGDFVASMPTLLELAFDEIDVVA